MKKELILALLCSLCLVAGERFAPNAVSPRVRKTDNARKTLFFDKGKAQFEIVVPMSSAPIVKFAGEELASLLEKSLGVKLSIQKSPTGIYPAIRVGDINFARQNGLDPSTLDRDGYFIKTIGRDILIIGCDDAKAKPFQPGCYFEHATLFGVYDFLETFAGMRFFFPGDVGTITPKLTKWEVPKIDITERPDFQYRRTYAVHQFRKGPAEWYDESNQKESERLAWFRYRLNTKDIPNCHGLAFLGLKNRFAKTHPEYFALTSTGKRMDGSNITHKNDIEGHVCFSSEELKNEIFLDAKAFLSGENASSRGIIMNDGKSYWSSSRFPAGPFFNIMPADSAYLCQCEQCKPHFDKGPQETSNYIWKFKTDIARRMQEEKLPGYATMMAYSSYKLIPDLEIPSNVIVMLANLGPWAELQPLKRDEDDKQLRLWYDKLGSKTYLWTYPSKYGARIPLVPNFAPNAVGNYFKRQAPFIFGAFMEAETDRWIFNAFNFYIFSRVMWNEETNVQDTIGMMYNTMFGPGAPQVTLFLNSLEEKWMKEIQANFVETNAGPVTVMPSAFDIWTKIYSKKYLAQCEQWLAEAEEKCKDAPDYLRRVKFMRRQYLEPIYEGYKDFVSKATDRDTWCVGITKATQDITVDGVLNESIWQECQELYLLPALRQKNEPCSVHTKFKIAFDDENLYIAAICDEPKTDAIIAYERTKDDVNIWTDNNVEIFLNPNGDRKSFYQIQINSLGCVSDRHFIVGDSGWEWNCQMEVKTTVQPGKSWTAEIRIPLNEMEVPANSCIVANFNRSRVIRGQTAEYYSWSPFVDSFMDVENFGIIALFPMKNSNILKDSDFQAEITNKRFIGAWASTPCISRDEKIYRTAGASLMMDDNDPTVSQYLPQLKCSTKYKLSFYVRLDNIQHKSEADDGVYAIVRFGDSRNFRFPEQSLYGTIPWTRMETTFETPSDINFEGKPYIRLVSGKNSTGKAWFDNVRLEELKQK